MMNLSHWRHVYPNWACCVKAWRRCRPCLNLFVTARRKKVRRSFGRSKRNTQYASVSPFAGGNCNTNYRSPISTQRTGQNIRTSPLFLKRWYQMKGWSARKVAEPVTHLCPLASVQLFYGRRTHTKAIGTGQWNKQDIADAANGTHIFC